MERVAFHPSCSTIGERKDHQLALRSILQRDRMTDEVPRVRRAETHETQLLIRMAAPYDTRPVQAVDNGTSEFNCINEE